MIQKSKLTLTQNEHFTLYGPEIIRPQHLLVTARIDVMDQASSLFLPSSKLQVVTRGWCYKSGKNSLFCRNSSLGNFVLRISGRSEPTFYFTFQITRKASQSYSKVFALLGIKFASSSVRKVSGKRVQKTF